MRNKKNVKILVCCHKKDVMATQEPYMPIHVGKALHPELDLGIQGDNTGENISEKNGSYCELTGMYWAWKNLKNVDIIGLSHYRRYFDFHNMVKWPYDFDVIPTKDFENVNLDITDKIISYVKEGGLIMSKPKIYPCSLAEDYCVAHIGDDFRALQHVIKTTQSDEIRRAFHVVMHKKCSLMPYNMFLMRWDMFDEYCKWLFPLLQEVEKVTDISHYNPVQSRIYGYMAERLFNVWAYANADKLMTLPIIQVTDSPRPSVLSQSKFHYQFNRIRYKVLRVLLNRSKSDD